MIKYEMLIDNETYNAIFKDHFEAADFIDECDRDGQEVVVLKYYEVGKDEILADDDFSWAYKVEILGIMLLPNHADFPKWNLIEDELKRLGYLA